MTYIHTAGISRRNFLLATSAGALSASAPRLWADTMRAIPEVDQLSVQIVTDNATFGPFLENLNLPGLQVLRAGNGGESTSARMLPRALMAEFGLSILAQSKRGAQTRRVLVDFGYSPEVLANNLALLGIDPQQIDAAVLSHGHLDHYGGYAGLLPPSAARERRVPLIVGGEETFCERIAAIGKQPLLMGSLDRGALKRSGFDVQVRTQPTVVADQAFTTGQIPLLSAERPAIPTQMRPGVGCDRNLLSPSKRELTQIIDDGEHELATCYSVKGLGLVVIASCSHRGILNSVRRAQAISGIQQVHAVIGGFHLVRPRTDDEARSTVTELARIDPAYIVPMHCTGEVFIAEALRVMPQKVIRPYVGSRFVFERA